MLRRSYAAMCSGAGAAVSDVAYAVRHDEYDAAKFLLRLSAARNGLYAEKGRPVCAMALARILDRAEIVYFAFLELSAFGKRSGLSSDDPCVLGAARIALYALALFDRLIVAMPGERARLGELSSLLAADIEAFFHEARRERFRHLTECGSVLAALPALHRNYLCVQAVGRVERFLCALERLPTPNS